MKVSRTMLGGLVAAVGLVVVVAAGGLASFAAGRSGAAALPPPTSQCTLHYVQPTDSWVCNATDPAHAPAIKAWVSGSWQWFQPPPPMGGGHGLPGHWIWVDGHLAPAASTAAVQAASVVVHGPPAGLPWTGPPGSAWRKGQPEPQPRPMIFMQVSASLAVAPASVTATAALYDWPAARPGTVTISVYSGSTGDACASPPLRTATAAALGSGLWRATLSGLVVGSYELQAQFIGAVGPMSTPCGRAALKVVTAPGTSQK